MTLMLDRGIEQLFGIILQYPLRYLSRCKHVYRMREFHLATVESHHALLFDRPFCADDLAPRRLALSSTFIAIMRHALARGGLAFLGDSQRNGTRSLDT